MIGTGRLSRPSSLGCRAVRRSRRRCGRPACRPHRGGRLDELPGNVLPVTPSLADKLLALLRAQAVQDPHDLLHLRVDRLVRLATIAWLPQGTDDPQLTDPPCEGE